MPADSSLVLVLLAVIALAYGFTALVPRVDALDRSYRKFTALTAIGVGMVVVLAFLPVLAGDLVQTTAETVLALATFAFVVLAATFLVDVADDWLRLFGDPDYNTLVEASIVVAVLAVLVVFLLATSP